jgi:hypothetical protein
LWNPETITTNVAVQLEATPSVSDRLIAVAGAFPATESLTITLRLDRTNDFACIYNHVGSTEAGSLRAPYQVSQVTPGTTSAHFITASSLLKFTGFYRTGFIEDKSSSLIADKLVDLMDRGTIADIEYLYKAINGVGAGKSGWVNARGTLTSDIGYLMPTLLNIDIGPLSYQGYVTNLSVTHIGFTKNMVPIRSDVTISLNLLATSGLNSVYAKDQQASSTAGTGGSGSTNSGSNKGKSQSTARTPHGITK